MNRTKHPIDSVSGCFTYGSWSIISGFLALVSGAATVDFITSGLFGLDNFLNRLVFTSPKNPDYSNPLFRDLANRTDVALLSMTLGVFFYVLVFFFGTEFWRRTRPTKIDDRGVTTYFLGRQLQFLPWTQMAQIHRLRYFSPTTGFIESVWFEGMPATGGPTTPQSKAIAEFNVTSLLRSSLMLFPPRGIWMKNFMGQSRFRQACELATHFALMHKIPMKLHDIGPDTLGRIKPTISPDAYRRARRHGVTSSVDHL